MNHSVTWSVPLPALMALVACAQPVPGSLAPARVIIQFKQAAAYSSDAWVDHLARQALARISYVASVSDDTHVYLVTPLTGGTLADSLKRLQALPGVQRTEVDQLLSPHPGPGPGPGSSSTPKP